MARGIEGWIEYKTGASSFSEDERREIGEHALAAALFCFMQEYQSDDETTHYDTQPSAYDDETILLYLRHATATLFAQMEARLETFGVVFESSFEDDLAHRVKAVRGSRELSLLPECYTSST